MNCFIHNGTAAIGLCSACQKAMCRACVGRESPRLVCAACARGGAVLGYEYVSDLRIAGWPLIHVCVATDAATGRPKVARGIIAIGNVATGGLAVGGLAFGLLAVGGLSIGLLFALGGAALGLGLAIGGFAFGSIAFGGAAIGLFYAVGGGALAPEVISGNRCDEAARELWIRWLGQDSLPPPCR